MLAEQEQFLRWLHHPNLDAELRQELQTLQGNEAEIKERFYTTLSFGTGGLRAEMGAGSNRLNIYTVRKATLGLAHYVRQAKVSLKEAGSKGEDPKGESLSGRSVVIAYDCRHQSERFALEAALTLAQEGVRAYLFPSLRPTPQLSYTVRRLGASAGIVITASHNPPEYNGYKVYGADGAQINGEPANELLTFINQIEDELAITIMDKEQALNANLLVYIDEQLDQEYTDYVASLTLQPELIAQMAEHYHIVFTPLHGTSLVPVRRVLKQAGFTKVYMVQEQMKPDPDFSTVASPNPEDHEAFTLAIRYAQDLNADIIMGTDPDADRMGVVVRDLQGEYRVLTGNQTGALLLHYILSQMKQKGSLKPEHTICKTIVTSELGRKIGESFGLETLDTLTGFKYIGELIESFSKQGDKTFVFGYEESYGYLIGDEVRDKDAIQAVLLAAEMGAYYKSQGLGLYEALERLYQEYGYYKEELISITLKGIEGVAQIQQIIDSLRRQPPQRLAGQQITIIEDYERKTRLFPLEQRQESLQLPQANVLKYILEDGSWFCVRPSGTEPKLKIYLSSSASSAEEIEQKMKRFKQEVEGLLPS